MNLEKFLRLIDARFSRCKAVLTVKAGQYATEDDRLHNFKVAAELQGKTPLEALGGIMVKHVVCIFDSIPKGAKVGTGTWDELITDTINYLLLMEALVMEQKGVDKTEEKP